MTSVHVQGLDGLLLVVFIVLGLLIVLLFSGMFLKIRKLIWLSVGFTFALSATLIYFFLSLSSVFTPSQSELLEVIKDTTSPEDLVKESNEFVLTGSLSFRGFELEDPEWKYDLELTDSSSFRDSVITRLNHINVCREITENSSTWNIIYLDSSLYKIFRPYRYDTLKKKNLVLKTTIRAVKLANNEWLGKKVLELELQPGVTTITD
jgi:hypothetical protein